MKRRLLQLREERPRDVPATAPPRPAGKRPAWPPLEEASQLALRNLWHWRTRTIILVCLTALAVASYLATSMFTAETMAGLVPDADLGLSDLIVVELADWSYLQTRFLDDPLAVEIPRTETRLRALVTDEPDGELALLLANPAIEQCYVARRLTLQWPWGTDELLSAPAALIDGIMPPDAIVAGRGPANMAEVALPVDLAARVGLSVGDKVAYTAIDPLTTAKSSHTLDLVGLYESEHPFFGGALGWLPDGYPAAYVTSTQDHYPRTLATIEPNMYVIRVAEDVGATEVAHWLRETGYIDSDGCWHFHERYPTVRLWNDAIAGDALMTGVGAQTTALGGIILLSLSFVGVGALTMFLLGFLDRRREIAVLKAVGFGGPDIAAVFGLEVVYTGLAGLAVGCLLSYGLLSGWLGRALPAAMVVRAAVVTFIVLGLAALLPIAMAGAATVTELLVGRKVIAVFRQRVSTR